MSNAHYLDSLYPLQDRVLKILEGLQTPFYLTGGTALSRCYLQHRFSDDLDFCVNRRPEFEHDTPNVLAAMRADSSITIEVETSGPEFMRCQVVENSVRLKLDFVNDIFYRYGAVQPHGLFYRVDNLRNILSNKFSALSRNEAKDVADIIFICKNIAFNWREVMAEGQQKDDWVNPLEISRYLAEYDIHRLEKIQWLCQVDYTEFAQYLGLTAREILFGTDHHPG